MRNLRLLIEYDGTRYGGWQRQENSRTVQGEVESALATMLQEAITVNGAGRTDAGVHARGQVANFKTVSSLTAFEILGGLNGLLPDDIVVHEVVDVPPEFHARFSARGRSYSYRITRRRSALSRQYSWFVKYKLDVDSMQAAAGAIMGEHDFTSFCKTGSEPEHCRCTVNESGWMGEGEFLIFAISADRFLYGMVRALVGTMVDVGRGFISNQDFLKVLAEKDRTKAGMAAPAHGLVLEAIRY